MIVFGNIKIIRYKRARISWRCSIFIKKPRQNGKVGFKSLKRQYDEFYQMLICWAFNNINGRFRPFYFGTSMGIDFNNKDDAIRFKEYLKQCQYIKR